MAQGLASTLYGKTATRTLRIPHGPAFPADPQVGELFFNTATDKISIFLGIGEPGCDAAGWFNLKYAQYSL